MALPDLIPREEREATPEVRVVAPALEEPRASETSCTHCGLPMPAGLVDAGAPRQFCCTGCRTAYAILHEHGLERYYELAERRDAPVRPTGRSYEEFDHAAFHALYVTHAGARSAVELYLEGVHCASCVWLVERVPLLLPGVARAELNVRRSLARIEWDAAAVPLSAVARMLDSLGYAPHPFRGVRADAMRRRADRAMLVRIGIAGAIAINVMLAALALYSGWLGGMEHADERFFRWLSLALVTPAMLGPARVFFAGAWSALRARTLHMDLPIALALAVGYVRGAMNTITDHGPIYFDGLAALIFALLAGRFLQQRGQRRAADAAELLYSLTPGAARIVEGERVRDVPTEAVLPGMTLEVRAGETLAADGVITEGHATLDLSLLTGESRPVSAAPGERVYAGTTTLSATLRVRVERAGEQSRLARILRQVEESAERRAPVVQLANRLAGWFTAAVLVLAALTFGVWWLIEPSRAADSAIALLIVTCPCALALATPLAVSVAVGRAARRGIFIKGGDALEHLARPGRVLLDKTGTITLGRTTLVEWRGADRVRPLVLAVERESLHPIAAGFRAAWPTLDAPRARDVRTVIGAGIEGTVDGQRVVIGSAAFLATRSVPVARASGGDTRVYVAVGGALVATARFGDAIRRDARAAVDALRARGWRVGILSGDASEVVQAAARALGIAPNDCVGGASPEDKVRVVERAAAVGPVMMVGDGVNDAAAIAAATVGVGVRGGAEASLGTADVSLREPGLAPVVALVDGARRTMRVIRRNIAFSILYNVVGATLAITGRIDPLIAALLMPASSLTVLVASWRGRTFDAEQP